jgi:hypothetical protein
VNLHTDIPGRGQIDVLLAGRDPVERVDLAAVRRLEDAGTARSDVAAVEDGIAGLDADGTFCRYQVRSLALFATPALFRRTPSKACLTTGYSGSRDAGHAAGASASTTALLRRGLPGER